MSFRKSIDFLLREPSVALPINQALRQVVAAQVHTSDAGKAKSDSSDARHKAADASPNEAKGRIVSFHGV